MEMFRVLYGSWPEWEGKLDSGQIVFIRIRHGQVWIGKAETGEAASESATLVKESMRDYFGVTDVIEALEELRQQGYYFVPPTSMEKGAKLYAGSPGGHNVKELSK
jgi:hypothetical protein